MDLHVMGSCIRKGLSSAAPHPAESRETDLQGVLKLLVLGQEQVLLPLDLPHSLVAGPLCDGMPQLQCVLPLQLAVVLGLHQAVLQAVNLHGV